LTPSTADFYDLCDVQKQAQSLTKRSKQQAHTRKRERGRWRERGRGRERFLREI
jgi:hypothetical protein